MTVKSGEDHPNCTVSDEGVELIRQLYEYGLTLPEAERRRCGLGYKGIAKRFLCSPRVVRDIVHYRSRI